MIATRSPLTERQQEVYDAIVDLVGEIGCWPTIREIGDRIGVSSPNGVMCNINAMRKKGYVTAGTYRTHCIRLCGFKLVMVPEESESPA